MSRCLLHKTKLESLKCWLDAQQIAHRAGKGDFEVLQIKHGTGWAAIYDRHSAPEHYTSDKRLDALVRRFIRNKPSNAELRRCVASDFE